MEKKTGLCDFIITSFFFFPNMFFITHWLDTKVDDTRMTMAELKEACEAKGHGECRSIEWPEVGPKWMADNNDNIFYNRLHNENIGISWKVAFNKQAFIAGGKNSLGFPNYSLLGNYYCFS